MDTIFAVSSGVGRSAVAVVRISGPGCGEVAIALCGRVLRPRHATLAELRDPASGAILDQALCLAFPAPASFTGEDCLELHVHGGRAVVQSILAALGGWPGLRAAEPGEFTRRAFQNGKMNLDSAEGLADLIQADTALQQRQALAALSGGLQRSVTLWRERLISSQAMLEAWLDFPDESEVSDSLIGDSQLLLRSLICELEEALQSVRRAEILRDGVKVLIAGPPNAGKSSLLNRLAQKDAAIVSEVAGTTRDIIEVSLDVDGAPVTFLDGAGIRATVDPIETIGVERVKGAARKADVILWLAAVDAGDIEPPDWIVAQSAKLIHIVSKVDLAVKPRDGRRLSVVTGQGIDDLMLEIGQIAKDLIYSGDSQVQLRERHVHAVSNVLTCLRSGLAQLSAGNVELCVEDCRHALIDLGRVGQPVHAEDVLDAVFSRFCIGK